MLTPFWRISSYGFRWVVNAGYSLILTVWYSDGGINNWLSCINGVKVYMAVESELFFKVLTYMLTVNINVNIKIFIKIPYVDASEVIIFYFNKCLCIYI